MAKSIKKTGKLEKSVERDHIKAVKNTGGVSYKFVSPGHNGVPDRIDLYGIEFAAEHLMDLINEAADQQQHIDLKRAEFNMERLLQMAIQFTETKRPGGKLRKSQKREHERLLKRGFTVNVYAGS